MSLLVDDPDHHDRLARESRRLLGFAAASRNAAAFGWLDDRGDLTPGRPDFLYVTCRMTHSFALGGLLGFPGAADLVDHGLAALRTTFADEHHGGWFTAVGPDGARADRKWAYPHAFVLLATASASVAGRAGARDLLEQAAEVLRTHFWDEEAGMLLEEWDAAFSTLSDYRGANANMHGVEAMLAAADATGDEAWLTRAERVAGRMVDAAHRHRWRLPEHYDAAWRPDHTYGSEHPDDPFKPYGTMPGHSLEWARLLLHLRAGLRAPGRAVPDWITRSAVALAERAISDGWAADGAPGFVYTVDPEGRPLIRQRLHWVLCEALGAAACLWRVTGDEIWAHRYAEWWSHAETAFIDPTGSWHHELDPAGRPAAKIRPGKADAYHALQATLLPRVTITASLAGSLAARRAAGGEAEPEADRPAGTMDA
ncbi:AGE family epimerase/isomerase [Georgenia deserti]|uniref:AGE family epimerase/isomerase n=1 Tax=Georgenia deserti TaxID=2093781 RepID=A0ABW4L2H7_9MICO